MQQQQPASKYNGRRLDGRSYGRLHCEHVILLGVGPQKELFFAEPPALALVTDGDNIVVEGEQHQQMWVRCAPPAEWERFKPRVNNRLSELLLPMCTPQAFLDDIDRALEQEALIMWDSDGRVHQIILGGCVHLLMMELWAPPAMHTKRLWIERISSAEERLYAQQPYVGPQLRLPPGLPDEFNGTIDARYEVRHDQLGRVFSFYSLEHACEQDAVRVELGDQWETRLFPLR